MKIRKSYISVLGFPCGSIGKESACNVGDLGLISGLGRSPGGGKGYPLQYSGLENCLGHKELDKTGRFPLSLSDPVVQGKELGGPFLGRLIYPDLWMLSFTLLSPLPHLLPSPQGHTHPGPHQTRNNRARAGAQGQTTNSRSPSAQASPPCLAPLQWAGRAQPRILKRW